MQHSELHLGLLPALWWNVLNRRPLRAIAPPGACRLLSVTDRIWTQDWDWPLLCGYLYIYNFVTPTQFSSGSFMWAASACLHRNLNMAFSTSAITKIRVKARFKPKLRVRHFWPYVLIRDLLAVWRVNLWGPFFLSGLVAGIIDICAPLSTRKRIPVVWSCTNNKRLILL